MKIRWIGLLVFTTLLGAGPALALEEPFYVEQVLNQNTISVYGPRQSGTCQAVRITPTWYLTAAHCVYDFCQKACIVEIELLHGDLQAIAQVHHSVEDPTVFVQKYDPNGIRSVRDDLALIHFTQTPQDMVFVDNSSKEQLTYEDFMRKLKASAEQYAQWRALEKSHPVMLTTDNVQNRHLNLPIGVPDLRRPGWHIAESSAGDFYYFTELWHYLGMNFGVGKGMSGSGVIFHDGRLLGIVSTNLNKSGLIVTYNEQDEPIYTLPYSSNYFLITPFNYANQKFIESTILLHRDGSKKNPRFGSLTERDAPATDKTLEQVYGEGDQAAVLEEESLESLE